MRTARDDGPGLPGHLGLAPPSLPSYMLGNKANTVSSGHVTLWTGTTHRPTRRTSSRGVSGTGAAHVTLNARRMYHRLLDRTMDDVRTAVDQKHALLTARVYHVVTIWECQWNALKQSNPEVRGFVASLNLQDLMNPRDAFFFFFSGFAPMPSNCTTVPTLPYQKRFGITTTPVSTLGSTRYGKYPVGHQEFIYEPDTTDLSSYFGLAKVTILPPAELYHPVLPYRTGDKLTFPLCLACVESDLDQPLHHKTWLCHHEDDQRALTGTWYTSELDKAVEQGYTVLAIHEVWHFAEQQVGLFKDYVNTWLKIKTKASGWAMGCDTEEQRQAYIDNFRTREGIDLEYHKIKHNPGLRSLAKMILNSMWRKFGQRPNKTQIKEFIDPPAFTRFLDSE